MKEYNVTACPFRTYLYKYNTKTVVSHNLMIRTTESWSNVKVVTYSAVREPKQLKAECRLLLTHCKALETALGLLLAGLSMATLTKGEGGLGRADRAPGVCLSLVSLAWTAESNDRSKSVASSSCCEGWSRVWAFCKDCNWVLLSAEEEFGVGSVEVEGPSGSVWNWYLQTGQVLCSWTRSEC